MSVYKTYLTMIQRSAIDSLWDSNAEEEMLELLGRAKYASDSIIDGYSDLSYSDSIVNTVVKAAPTEGSQLLLNTDFASWNFEEGTAWSFIDTDDFDGDGWFASDWGGDDEGVCVTPHVGTYAVVLETDYGHGEGDPERYAIEQAVAGLTPDDNYVFKIYAKFPHSSDYDSGGVAILFLDDEYDSATQMYNNSTHAWEAIGVGPSDNNIDDHSLTITWTEYEHDDSDNLVVPASGTINVVVMSSPAEEEMCWIDSATLQKDGAGDSVLVDGSFEAPDFASFGWPGGFWMEDYIADEEEDWETHRSTDSQTGTYALEMISDDDGDSGLIILVQHADVDPSVGDPFRAKVYAKRENSTDKSNITFLAINTLDGGGDEGDDIYLFHWGRGEWVEIDGEFDPSELADYQDTRTLTGDYVEYASKTITVPAEGDLIFLVAHEAGEDAENESIFVDNFRAYELTLGAAIAACSCETVSDFSNLDTTDAALLIKSTGGTGKEMLRVGKNGAFTNGGTGFDFSGEEVNFGEISVEDPTSPESPITKEYFESNAVVLLGQTEVGAINLKNVTTTPTDFDMPNGYRLINPQVMMVTETAEALNVNATIKVGTADNYDNIFSLLSYEGSSGHQRLTNLSGSAGGVVNNAGEVKFNVTVADTGTSGTATGYLFGMLVEEDDDQFFEP